MDKNYKREDIKLLPETNSAVVEIEAEAENIETGKIWHPQIKIIYINFGTARITFEDHETTLTAGHYCLINSNELHSVCYEVGCEGRNIYISSDIFNQIIPDFNNSYFPHMCDDPELEEKIVSSVRTLSSLNHSKENGWHILYLSNLYSLIYYLYKNGFFTEMKKKNTKSVQTVERLEIILSYTESYYKEPILLSSISGLVGLNPEYFCRFFKKHMGMSYQRYLNSVRASHIYSEIINTDDKITDIAKRNGMNNYHLFLEVFKEIYGTSPHKIRKLR